MSEMDEVKPTHVGSIKSSYDIYKNISIELNHGTRKFKEIVVEAQNELWERIK